LNWPGVQATAKVRAAACVAWGKCHFHGGHRDPRKLALDHQKLMQLLDDERFYSTILNLKVGDQTQAAILKDVQRHPAHSSILHIDLQRVVENEKIRIRIPLHFKGESIAIGVKEQGGIVSHQKTELDISCPPNDLPEFIEVDVSGLALNQRACLSDSRFLRASSWSSSLMVATAP
jgi:large subunit ribosomal protein L25